MRTWIAISPAGEFQEWAELDLPHLRVQVQRPEYLRLTEPEQVMAIVQTYYDPARIVGSSA